MISGGQLSQYLTKYASGTYERLRASAANALMPPTQKIRRMDLTPHPLYISPRVSTIGTAIFTVTLLSSSLVYQKHRDPVRDYSSAMRPSSTAVAVLNTLDYIDRTGDALTREVSAMVPHVTTKDIKEVAYSTAASTLDAAKNGAYRTWASITTPRTVLASAPEAMPQANEFKRVSARPWQAYAATLDDYLQLQKEQAQKPAVEDYKISAVLRMSAAEPPTPIAAYTESARPAERPLASHPQLRIEFDDAPTGTTASYQTAASYQTTTAASPHHWSRISIKRITQAQKTGSLWSIAASDLQERTGAKPKNSQVSSYLDEICRLNGKYTLSEWERLADKNPQDPRNPNLIVETQDVVLPFYLA